MELCLGCGYYYTIALEDKVEVNFYNNIISKEYKKESESCNKLRLLSKTITKKPSKK